MLCALTARDILWLRGTLVLAQSLLALYASRLGVWSVATWNAVFVLINVTWVLKILRERRAVALPDEMGRLHERHFFALTPPEFLRWWQQGRREVIRGERLTEMGAYPDALVFVLSGRVRVTRGDEHVTDVVSGQFVGEMSLITGNPATADAVVVDEAEVVRWPADQLQALKRRDAALWTRIQSVLGQDLVVKLGQRAPSAQPMPGAR
jgi:CRP-like cAMP-binding protein